MKAKVKLCQECGAEFVRRSPAEKYCSRECRLRRNAREARRKRRDRRERWIENFWEEARVRYEAGESRNEIMFDIRQRFPDSDPHDPDKRNAVTLREIQAAAPQWWRDLVWEFVGPYWPKHLDRDKSYGSRYWRTWHAVDGVPEGWGELADGVNGMSLRRVP